VAALQAQHQQKAQQIGDAIVQAIYDVHDALNPQQRRALVDYVRAHHPPAGGHAG
jgi:hypothetical protein